MKRWLTTPTLAVAAASASVILLLAIWGTEQQDAAKNRANEKMELCANYSHGLRGMRSTYRRYSWDRSPREFQASPHRLVVLAIEYCLSKEESSKRRNQLDMASEKLGEDDIEGATKLWLEVAAAVKQGADTNKPPGLLVSVLAYFVWVIVAGMLLVFIAAFIALFGRDNGRKENDDDES